MCETAYMKTQSPVTAAENAAFAAFRADMQTLPSFPAGLARAFAQRQVMLKHADSPERRARMESQFRELGLAF